MTESPQYDYELERIIKEIKKSKARRVGLQLPEGLKVQAAGIAKEIEEKTGTETIIFIDPVYGACDTKQNDAEMLGLDILIHFGHTKLKPRFT